ncbi:MAG: hypothetical protein WB988_11275 [Candidatus Nitrosopolaris sp.]
MMLFSIPHALGFLTFLSTDIGTPDIKHQCPNDNSSSSCYSLGLRSGLVAGKEMRESDFAFSFGVSFGCWHEHSPNFCLGYLVSFDKAFLGHPANSSQIWQVANKTGWDEGGQNTTASRNPPCTVNALFCVPFTKAYEQSYAYHIPYWAGVKAGNKYADHVIDTCTQKNHPNFGFLEHHIAQYKKGFLDGYGNSVAAASNANGMYGPKGCHR